MLIIFHSTCEPQGGLVILYTSAGPEKQIKTSFRKSKLCSEVTLSKQSKQSRICMVRPATTQTHRLHQCRILKTGLITQNRLQAHTLQSNYLSNDPFFFLNKN